MLAVLRPKKLDGACPSEMMTGAPLSSCPVTIRRLVSAIRQP